MIEIIIVFILLITIITYLIKKKRNKNKALMSNQFNIKQFGGIIAD